MSNPKKSGINTQDVLAMRGEGYYSERTAGARNVINDAGAMVFDAIREIYLQQTLYVLLTLEQLTVEPVNKCGIWSFENAVNLTMNGKLK